MTGGRPVFYPSVEQELLLKAILMEGSVAIESWRTWRSLVAIEDLDFGSQRLLPCLYQRLLAAGVSDPDMERYRGVHRHMWVANHHRLRQAVQLLQLLDQAAIPVILLKGIALGPLYYDDLGQRPMNDIDFLVPPDCAARAGQILLSLGWQSADMGLLASPPFLRTNHAITFTKPGTTDQTDLHWHVADERCWDGADRLFWERAQTMTLGGRSVLTLSDTDHLLHTCLHGTKQNDVAPIRWIADSMAIMRRRQIDWPYFVRQVHDNGYCRRLSAAFRYLDEVFKPPLPDTLLDDLAAGPHNRIERLEEFLSKRQLPEFLAVLGQVSVFWLRHPDYAATPRGGFRFLRDRWGTSSVLQTLVESSHRSAKHIFLKA